MTIQHLIVLAIPGLRPGDVDQKTTPTLFDWANQGVIAELTPTFPCVTSPVQANMFLIRKPVKPRRNPVIALRLGEVRYRSWKAFLDNAYWTVELRD